MPRAGLDEELEQPHRAAIEMSINPESPKACHKMTIASATCSRRSNLRAWANLVLFVQTRLLDEMFDLRSSDHPAP